MELQIPAITIKAALAGFNELGLKEELLLEPIGLSMAQLNNPFASVPNEAFSMLWIKAFEQDADPTLPIRAGFAVPFGEFGILDHLVSTAETIGESFHILNLFFWLVSTNLSLIFSHGSRDRVTIELNEPSRLISEQWTLAIIYQRMSSYFPQFSIRKVFLPHDVLLPITEYENLWSAPVEISIQHAGIELESGVWDAKNQRANPLLHKTLLSVAEQVELKQIQEAPLLFAIRTRLPKALESGRFSANDIAEELGLSKRTFQRKLSEQNITFKGLLDLYRQERAMFMLQERQADIGQIAYALGYNEQSSFNRAFRRWTGKSPSNWIQQI